ncbi:MAG TPA: hypothetical protein VGO50_03950 [Pyrinomonadaceae bacterium]|jgi:hypothetical protein|nr:hypothetical protein [Pyrinomonadaceae bacterium]
MKRLFLLTVISALLLVSAAFAQKAQRITFKRGAKQAIASGTLYSYKGQRVYVIRVRAGQILKTEQVGEGHAITIAVIDPHGEIAADFDASCNNRKQTEETMAGDYKIIVSECSKADAWRGTFRFKVRIE